MDELKSYLDSLITDKRVEPNSTMGKAANYMRDRWTEMTRFLELPGAPLDNNLCEQALKMAIRHRNNSLFYKTDKGAMVGDLYMSLIQTCENNKINPLDYLTTVLQKITDATKAPEEWMPWNYRETMKKIRAPALDGGWESQLLSASSFKVNSINAEA